MMQPRISCCGDTSIPLFDNIHAAKRREENAFDFVFCRNGRAVVDNDNVDLRVMRKALLFRD
jgi:hypothetical protein